MALLFLDSFDHYVTADILEKYALKGASSVAITAAVGRRSSAALVLTNEAGYVTTGAFSPAPATTVIVGVACKLSAFGGGNPQMAVGIVSGTTRQLTITWDSTGHLQAWRGPWGGVSFGALLGTASVACTAGAFFYLELKAVIHPSAGSVILRLNETEVLNLTGVNTAQTGSAAWDAVTLNGAGVPTFTLDDLYVCDSTGSAPCNDFLGDCRVDALYPTAEGASSAWTPLSGTDNALMVDETAPDDDTTYNSTATVGATDTHVVQDAPAVGATLYGVQLCLSQKKSDAGTCSIAPVVRHSSVDYPGTAVNPTTSYAYALTPYGLNPGTGAAWTEAGFNAAQFGYKRTA